MRLIESAKFNKGKEKLYFASLLLLESTLIGAFSALDLVLFYVFFEACLIPVWFLIGVFGGEKATKALMKFFLFTVEQALPIKFATLKTECTFW